MLLLYMMQIKKIRKQREYKIPSTNGGKLLRKSSSSFEKLLERVTFTILSNINDGASLRKYVGHLGITGLMVVVLIIFFTCGKLVLELSYFKVWLWDLGTNLCGIAPGK